jgi:hypothetical protein
MQTAQALNRRFFAVGVIGLAVAVFLSYSQPPSAPTGLGAASGTITVMLKGQTVGSAPILNFISGQGLIWSCSLDPALNAIDCQPDADTAFLTTQARDQNYASHILNGNSQFFGATPGVTYQARANPTLTAYQAGQFWVFFPDLDSQTNATLNIDSVGPIPMVGTCALPACLLIAVGSPNVTGFLVK